MPAQCFQKMNLNAWVGHENTSTHSPHCSYCLFICLSPILAAILHVSLQLFPIPSSRLCTGSLVPSASLGLENVRAGLVGMSKVWGGWGRWIESHSRLSCSGILHCEMLSVCPGVGHTLVSLFIPSYNLGNKKLWRHKGKTQNAYTRSSHGRHEMLPPWPPVCLGGTFFSSL